MIVYRLENQDGYGFWSSYEGRPFLSGHDGVWSKGCTVNRWGLPLGEWQYRYACDSLEALKHYFGTAWDGIMASGVFQVIEYKVRKNYVTYGEDNEELVFPIEKAERLTVRRKTERKAEFIDSPFGRARVNFDATTAIVVDEAQTITTEDWGKLIAERTQLFKAEWIAGAVAKDIAEA